MRYYYRELLFHDNRLLQGIKGEGSCSLSKTDEVYILMILVTEIRMELIKWRKIRVMPL